MTQLKCLALRVFYSDVLEHQPFLKETPLLTPVKIGNSYYLHVGYGYYLKTKKHNF